MRHELWTDTHAHAYGHGSDGRGGGWEGLAQVVCLRTTRSFPAGDHPDSIEHHLYITSLRPDQPLGRPRAMLRLARRHWEIENGLHHKRDRSMGEDADRGRRGATSLARLRALAVGLLAYLPGDSTPLKQIHAAAHVSGLVRLLKRKSFTKKHSPDF